MIKKLKIKNHKLAGVRNSLLVILFCVLLFNYGRAFFDLRRMKAEQNAFIEQIEITRKEIEVVDNKNSNLQKELLKAKDENTSLLEAIASLRENPSQIRYIVKTETVLEPVETETTFVELPKSYEHKMDNGLVVASFYNNENKDFSFNTYKLKLKSNLVIGKKRTAISTEVSSSYQPELWFEIPNKLELLDVRENKKQNVKLHLGAAYSFTENDVHPIVAVSLYEASSGVDLFNIYGGANRNTFKLGLAPAIFSPIKAIPNVSIFGGMSFNNKRELAPEIGIQTRL